MSHKRLTLSYFCELMMRLTLIPINQFKGGNECCDVCIGGVCKWLRWFFALWQGADEID